MARVNRTDRPDSGGNTIEDDGDLRRLVDDLTAELAALKERHIALAIEYEVLRRDSAAAAYGHPGAIVALTHGKRHLRAVSGE